MSNRMYCANFDSTLSGRFATINICITKTHIIDQIFVEWNNIVSGKNVIITAFIVS